MQETLPSPTVKIFKEWAIWVGTFLGGPLVAGYLLSENFKAFNQPEKVKLTWMYTVFATIIIIGIAFMIPDSVHFPSQVIPIAYTAIAYGVFKKYQEHTANEYIKSGGMVHSWWRVLGVGVIGLLVTMLPVFTVAYVLDTKEQPNITTKTYGVKVKHEISFDKSQITEEEIDLLADGFIESGFFDLSVAKYVYVKKVRDKYEISISVIEGIENDEEALEPFVQLRSDMDEYLPNNRVEIKLVVGYLDNVVKTLKGIPD